MIRPVRSADEPGEGGPAAGVPMGSFGAAAFQWVNPKAWVMAAGATATYTRADDVAGSALAVAPVFGAVNPPCVGVWALFDAAMALLLVASLRPIVAGR